MRNSNSILALKIKLINALSNEDNLSFTTLLDKYTIEKDASGSYSHYVGSNAIVLKLIDKKGNYFSCKILTEKSLADKYMFISENQKANNIKNIPPIELLKQEVLVKSMGFENGFFDVVIQPWVDGITLKETIINLTTANDTEGLKKLYSSFLTFINENKLLNYNQGDVSDTNIIVNKDGKLNFIDFDYAGFDQTYFATEEIYINQNFAHPNYKEFIYCNTTDDFSYLIIAASIYAYSLKPSLYLELYSENALLFTHRDYKKFENSRIFDYLFELNDLFLDTLLFQIKISILRNSPIISKLSTILFPNEKYQKLIRQVKEKEFLETSIESKVEQIEVIQDKYVKQIIANTANEFYTSTLEDENKGNLQRVEKLKQKNSLSQMAFATFSFVLLSVFLFVGLNKNQKDTTNKNVSVTNKITAYAYHTNQNTNRQFLQITTEVKKIAENSNKVKNYTVKQNNFARKTNITTPAVLPQKTNQVEKNEKTSIEKYSPSVIFKEIEYSK